MFLFNDCEFKKCVDCYKGNWRAIRFNSRDRFSEIIFAQFSARAGLRVIETTLNELAEKTI